MNEKLQLKIAAEKLESIDKELEDLLNRADQLIDWLSLELYELNGGIDSKKVHKSRAINAVGFSMDKAGVAVALCKIQVDSIRLNVVPGNAFDQVFDLGRLVGKTEELCYKIFAESSDRKRLLIRAYRALEVRNGVDYKITESDVWEKLIEMGCRKVQQNSKTKAVRLGQVEWKGGSSGWVEKIQFPDGKCMTLAAIKSAISNYGLNSHRLHLERLKKNGLEADQNDPVGGFVYRALK